MAGLQDTFHIAEGIKACGVTGPNWLRLMALADSPPRRLDPLRGRGPLTSLASGLALPSSRGQAVDLHEPLNQQQAKYPFSNDSSFSLYGPLWSVMEATLPGPISTWL